MSTARPVNPVQSARGSSRHALNEGTSDVRGAGHQLLEPVRDPISRTSN